MSELPISRRKALSGIAAVGGAIGVGTAFSGTAAAASVDNLSINDDTVVTDDGTLTSVTVSVDGEWAFDGLDQDARAVHIQLQVRRPGYNWQNAGATVVGNFPASKARSGNFSLESDNLLNVLTPGHFEAGQDGGTSQAAVDARLIARPLPGKHADQNNDALAQGTSETERFNVTAMNEVAEVSVSGDGNTDAEGVNQGVDYDERYVSQRRVTGGPTGNGNLVISRGTMELLISYGQNWVTFEVHLDQPWSDPNESHANMALGFDTDVDGTGDFQVGWSSDEGTHWKQNNGGWSNWMTSLPGWLKASKDGDVLTFEVSRSKLGEGGKSFKFVANSSYGGDTHVNISTDPAHSWQGPDGSWTSSHYYVTENLE